MEIAGKTVEILSRCEDAPLVILNTAEGEGKAVDDALRLLTSSPYSLAAISGLSWYDDLTPWPAEGLASWLPCCKGLADDYIRALESEIVPGIIDTIGYRPSFVAIAGYSLAGLFAIYSLFRTDIFSAAASASGSLWYPGFLDYADNHDTACKPRCIYLSLGDKESSAGSKVMRSVGCNTVKLAGFFRKHGVECALELNKGNHFRETELRMAKGIAWIIATERLR